MYIRICVFVDHLTTNGLVLYVSNEQPLLDEVISVTAFLSGNDKVCVCICMCVCACLCMCVWVCVCVCIACTFMCMPECTHAVTLRMFIDCVQLKVCLMFYLSMYYRHLRYISIWQCIDTFCAYRDTILYILCCDMCIS